MNENNKRIAKNTLVLYMRMLAMMILGIFTSRITINALGVSDYGVNNVVAGFVSMLGFFNSILAGGSTRFITFYLGKGDLGRLREVFSACMTLHVIMALLVLIGGETIGLWFVNYQLNIDPDRMVAANWVYQFAILSACFSITQTPYTAEIMAHEKMSAFAWMVIFDVVVKLLLVALLLYVPTDKLILYSAFMLVVSIIDIAIARIYCHVKFEECSFKLGYDKPLYKEMANYTGWNTIGAFAFMSHNQGINILLNLFYGTVVNASRGIAFAVSGYVSSFISNFQSAAAPQIIKFHASGEDDKMNELIHNVSKYSTYLFFLFGIPLLIETEYFIRLWLGNVPQYVVWFVRLTLLQSMVMGIDFSIGRGIHAYGKMKLPNLVSGTVYLMILPLSYIGMKLGAGPVVSYVMIVAMYPIALLTDLWILKKFSGFEVGKFLLDVVARCFAMMVAISLLPIYIFLNLDEGLLRLFAVCSTSVLISIVVIYYWGLPVSLRQQVVAKVRDKLRIHR